MKAILEEKDLAHLPNKLVKLYFESDYSHFDKRVCDCGTIYCSKDCQDKSWNAYHQVLCSKVNPNIQLDIHKLKIICKETQRTNPMVALRAFGTVLSSVLKGEDLMEALRPYKRFITFNPKGERDLECFQHISNIFKGTVIEKGFFSFFNFLIF